MDREILRSAMSHRNVAAFSRVVREGESRQDDSAYRMRYGGHKSPPKYFSDLSRHPKVFEPRADGLKSSAAGAYQATWTTWNEEQRKWGWTDFSPASQDEFFVARLIYRRALQAVKDGRFAEACRLCRAEWTSLPGGAEENAATKRARATYAKWGGTFAPVAQPAPKTAAPVAPKEETMEPVTMSLMAGLAGKLIDAFSPIAKQKLSKAIARHSDPEVADKVAESVVAAAKSVTGEVDEVAAVAVAGRDPAVMEAVERQAVVNIEQLLPILDKVAVLEREAWAAEESSRNAAAARGREDATDLAPMLASWAVRGVYGLLILLFALILASMIVSPDNKPLGELVTAFTGLVMLVAGKFGTVYDYRFGSSRGSGAKDIVISELTKGGKP